MNTGGNEEKKRKKNEKGERRWTEIVAKIRKLDRISESYDANCAFLAHKKKTGADSASNSVKTFSLRCSLLNDASTREWYFKNGEKNWRNKWKLKEKTCPVKCLRTSPGWNPQLIAKPPRPLTNNGEEQSWSPKVQHYILLTTSPDEKQKE